MSLVCVLMIFIFDNIGQNNELGYSRIRGVTGVKQVACGLKHTIIMGEYAGVTELWG